MNKFEWQWCLAHLLDVALSIAEEKRDLSVDEFRKYFEDESMRETDYHIDDRKAEEIAEFIKRIVRN